MIDEDAGCGDDYGNLVPPLLALMINDDAGCGDEDPDDCYDGNPAPPLAFGGPDDQY